jgi:hypothetical protein
MRSNKNDAGTAARSLHQRTDGFDDYFEGTVELKLREVTTAGSIGHDGD